jgi:REP element-mobilizing transposase RayT
VLAGGNGYIDGVSRLRRLFLSDHYFFLTVDLLRSKSRLEESDFQLLASSIVRVRAKYGFALTAWVFLSDHRHAIVFWHFVFMVRKSGPSPEGEAGRSR